MIDEERAAAIALGIVREYDRTRFPAKCRDREFYLHLDRMVYRSPEEAILVITAIAGLALSPQAVEGIGGGAIREMLLLYDNKYDAVFDRLAASSCSFKQVLEIARDGVR